MKTRKIIIINNTAYSVTNVREVKYQRTKPGTIERHLRGDIDNNWLIDYIDYHVTARNKLEGFDRIFVLTEGEARDQLFI